MSQNLNIAVCTSQKMHQWLYYKLFPPAHLLTIDYKEQAAELAKIKAAPFLPLPCWDYTGDETSIRTKTPTNYSAEFNWAGNLEAIHPFIIH